MSILIRKDTTFIVQGITGREAVNLTRENLDYGAKIVGGVTPGRAGRDVYGVPVFDCVRDVVEQVGQPEGSIVSVPPKFTADAMFEALENGIKLIVVVTENVPRGEVAQAVELANLRDESVGGLEALFDQNLFREVDQFEIHLRGNIHPGEEVPNQAHEDHHIHLRNLGDIEIAQRAHQ